MVHVVLRFFIEQDLPLAVTLLPVIFEPPLEFGSVIVTVMFTLPFLGVEEVMETIFGAEGLVTLDFACAEGAAKRLIQKEMHPAIT